jgi:outer membrane cobalamin receptor
MIIRPRKKITVFFISIFWGCFVGVCINAQSTVKIHGRVVDEETGQPLAGANVLVQGTGYGAVTDENGMYRIEDLFVGEYSLQASYLGYETRHMNVFVHRDATSAVHFHMKRTYIPVGQIIIEAERSQDQDFDFFESLTFDDIKRSNARTVDELLDRVPGVHVIDEGAGSGRKRVSIRGSRSNQVLVLLDGIPLNDQLSGDVDFSLISVSAVEEIRIAKSGSSHSFGSGALGGVIHIITKQNPVEEIKCGFSLGDFQAFGINPGFSGKIKRFSCTTQYEHLKDEGTYEFEYVKGDSQTVKAERRNADFRSHNLFGNITCSSRRHEFTLKVNLYESDRGLPGLVHALTPYARAETVRRIFQVRHRLTDGAWRWHASVSRHDNNSEYRHLPPSSAPLEDRSQPPYHTTYDFSSHQANLQFDWSSSDKAKLETNATVRRDRYEDEDLLWPGIAKIGRADNSSYGLGLHSEATLSLPFPSLQFKLSSALRFDGIEFKHEGAFRKEEKLSPNLALLLSRTGDSILTVRTSWGRSFRAPTFADLFYQDVRINGNPDLKAESSENLDVGIRIGAPVWGWLEMKAEYFRRNVKDLIVWRQGSFATFSPVNTDALISGTEFSGDWELWKHKLLFHLNHLILNPINKSGERTTHDKQIPYQANHMTKVGISFHLTPFSVDYRRRMVGQRYVTEANTIKLEPYAVDDVSMVFSTRMRGGDIQIKMSLFNLLNEEYEMIERAPLPRRHWRGGVEVSF